MARLQWGRVGRRYFEAGVDRGVLYVGSNPGVPWDGLINVEENPTGGEPKPYYIDGLKYANVPNAEEFEATLTAFTYPWEFEVCDGVREFRPGFSLSQQPRVPFGLCYRTGIGNDVNGATHAYKLHLIYGALAQPASRAHNTYSDSIEPVELAWNLTTRPPGLLGAKRTSHLIIDSRYTHPVTMKALENVLYGSDEEVPRLPTIVQIQAIYDVPVLFVVVDNGDGTYYLEGPDTDVKNAGNGLFELDNAAIVINDEDSFTITY